LFGRQAGILNDAAHRIRIDRVVARNCEDAATVTHHDVLALADDLETSFFQRSDSPKMINPWNPRHAKP
jgi:hypothetical protein